MRRALVLANKIVAGTLTETDDMRYIFKYDDEYLINPELRAIRALHYKTYSRIQESSLQEQYPCK